MGQNAGFQLNYDIPKSARKLDVAALSYKACN
jgi:hypothetical protein